MNWTGGRLRRHSKINGKSRKQTFGRPVTSSNQITLFNGFVKNQTISMTEGQGGGKTSHPADLESRATPAEPQTALKTNGTHASRPPDRLEQIKRRLLETPDWGAIGAARPVQVSFTPQEERERFGKRRRLTKKDHERLNTPTFTRPRVRKAMPPEDNIHEKLEIRIDGRRLGQGTVRNQESPLNMISSRPMLVDEESLDPIHRPKIQDSISSSSASASKLSMLVNVSQLCYISDVPGMTDSVSNTKENPIQHGEALDSVDRASEGPMREGQSTQNNLIFPQLESPIRRRFTIDEQAVADREGRFTISSLVAKPSPTIFPREGEFVHEVGSGAGMGSLKSSSQVAPRIFPGKCDGMTEPPTFPHVSWLPQPYRNTQHTASYDFVPRASIPGDHGNLSRPRFEKEQSGVMRIFGQPVVIREDGHTAHVVRA
ncbi:hypothetical protein BJX99DRAFT_84159 [Aspergillus californicus]